MLLKAGKPDEGLERARQTDLDLSDEFVLVSEGAIAAAMRQFIDLEHQLIEGAAGVALAAMLQQEEALAGRQVVVLICGGNVSRDTLKRIL